VSATGLAKAVIAARDGDARVECRFNPREYVVAKSATWTRTLARGAQSASMPEFVGTNPRTLQMELFFDDWQSGTGDIAKDVETLLGWTNPTQESIGANRPTPPIVFFQWGTKPLFNAYVKSISARYTMFRDDGSPVRAHVTAVFEEVPDEPGAQNPTSGGPHGRRVRVAMAGDSLHSIAHEEYGDPALWRALAAVNRIDDALCLVAGTRLLIPPAKTATELS
jgi:contractile injection system tube protein